LFPSLIGSSKTLALAAACPRPVAVSIPHRKFKNWCKLPKGRWRRKFPSLIGSSKTMEYRRVYPL